MISSGYEADLVEADHVTVRRGGWGPKACEPPPENPKLIWNPHLPDPFMSLDGSQVTTLGEWGCRQAEVSELLQRYELGVKPGKPAMSTSFSGDNITITCTEGSASITFNATITYPTSGQAPYPGLIALDGGSLPQPAGVALVSFTNDDIAQQNNQSSRGVGLFYDLYGADASAGALMAFAWAVSRVIDAVEMTPAANLDPTKLGVTGCSRNGKGTLVAGAYDERVVLTLPQESGSGGTDCWRLSDALFATGDDTQTAHEIVGENVWFSQSFDYFAANRTPLLPFDHHMLAGLVAPRALFSIDNTGYDWLGPQSAYGCMKSAQLIWQALGVTDHIGYSVAANHTHCVFPAAQQGQLDAFVDRFLLDRSTDTDIATYAGGVSFDQAYWDNWAVPDLTQ